METKKLMMAQANAKVELDRALTKVNKAKEALTLANKNYHNKLNTYLAATKAISGEYDGE